MKRYTYLFILIVVLGMISVISIGYASLNINLSISGSAVVDNMDGIYVSSIELIESVNSSELIDPSRTNNTTSLEVLIQNENSFFTYEVKIVNNSETHYYLEEIREISNELDIPYFITNLYKLDEFEPHSETVFTITYFADGISLNAEFFLELEYVFAHGKRYNDPVLAGSDPELIDGLIPIIYDEDLSSWVKADALNDMWYDYSIRQWANAASVVSSKKMYYVDASPGTLIDMEDITSMLVWIPRYSYTIRDGLGYQGYGGESLSLSTPGAIDIKFIGTDDLDTGSASYTGDTPNNYFTSSAFCWGLTCDELSTRGDEGNKEIPGFWIAKFEASWQDELLYSKPNETPAINLTISETFYLVQNLMNDMNGYKNYGYIGHVNAHLIKNTEWGAIAYLSQSKYGKYGNPDYLDANKEIYPNNCELYITGIGGDSPQAMRTKDTCYTNTYDTYYGMGASTTGNIYGVYDMVGGTFDRVMGTILNANGTFFSDSSGFVSLPEGRYINVYPRGGVDSLVIPMIKGDALVETLYFYGDRAITDEYAMNGWIYRGGSLWGDDPSINGIFSFTSFTGQADPHHSSRFTITMYR